MKCPTCAAPIAYGAPFCGLCHVALRWDGGNAAVHMPAIRPGDLLWTRDFAHGPLPGFTSRLQKWPTGSAILPMPDGQGFEFAQRRNIQAQLEVRLKDACVVGIFTAHDPDIIVAVSARAEPIDKAMTKYRLEVLPGKRTARLVCAVTSPSVGAVDELVKWAPHGSVAPPGTANVLELRVQGAALQGFVNGALVAYAHDATWGIGSPGLEVSREHETVKGPSRATCHRLEVRMVAA